MSSFTPAQRPSLTGALFALLLVAACTPDTPSPTPSSTPAGPTPTATATPTQPGATPTATATEPGSTPTATATATAAPTPTATATATALPPTPTAEPTPTATPTLAPTPTATPTPTPTPTATPTERPPTPTPTVPLVERSFYVYNSFPVDGAMGVPTANLSVKLYFTEAFTGADQDILGTLTDMTTGGTRAVSFITPDNSYALSSPALNVSANASYCLNVRITSQGPVNFTACFTTRKPCGTTVQVGADLVIGEFGAPADRPVLDVVKVLNGLLEAYGNDLRIAMMFDGVGTSASFPISEPLVVTGEYKSNGGTNAVPSSGWTSSSTGCEVLANGAFSCAIPEIVFPLPLYDDEDKYLMTLQLYLKGVTMTGVAKVSGNFTDLDAYDLRGHVLYDDVVRLAAQAGNEDISNLVILNYDTNEDGAFDAATFRLTSQPVPLALDGCNPGSL